MPSERQPRQNELVNLPLGRHRPRALENAGARLSGDRSRHHRQKGGCQNNRFSHHGLLPAHTDSMNSNLSAN